MPLSFHHHAPRCGSADVVAVAHLGCLALLAPSLVAPPPPLVAILDLPLPRWCLCLCLCLRACLAVGPACLLLALSPSYLLSDIVLIFAPNGCSWCSACGLSFSARLAVAVSATSRSRFLVALEASICLCPNNQRSPPFANAW